MMLENGMWMITCDAVLAKELSSRRSNSGSEVSRKSHGDELTVEDPVSVSASTSRFNLARFVLSTVVSYPLIIYYLPGW
jgi:hypothetical protein